MGRKFLPVYFILFFLSGATALTYEVLWLRQLSLVFGATAFAASATLGAFMAGLGIGGYVGGRIAAGHPFPLRLYGYLEIALVVAAGSVGFLLTLAESLFGLLYQYEYGTAALNVARGAVSFFVLFSPTVIMGATLPALAQAVVRTPSLLARPLGVLYGLNTLGAAVGSFTTGFFLLVSQGTTRTLILALGLNLLVGCVALGLSSFGSVPKAAPPVREAPERSKLVLPGLLVACFALSGLVALALEVVWTRTLVFFTGSTTYAFTLMLTVLLLGLATGSFLMSRFGDCVERRHLALSMVFVAIAVSAILGFLLLPTLADSLESWAMMSLSWGRMLAVIIALAATAVFFPAVGFGSVFPLVARHEMLRGRQAGEAAGRAYAANLTGAVTGAYVGGFLLVPLVGLYGSLRLLACGLLLAATALAAHEPGFRAKWKRRAAAVAAASLMLVPVMLVRGAPLHRPGPGETLLYYAEGASATVSVLRDPTGSKTLFIDRVGVAGTDPVMQTDQKSLAHLPMLLHPEPRSVLTVGFGSGGASWSYTRYPMLRRIDCVEIAPEVVEAAPFLREANHDLFDDPRYRVVIDDARSYLRHTNERYDVIATDCTDLQYRGNASLYTDDYFRICRRRLRPNGLVVVWMPLGGLSSDVFKTALNTFASVFPEVSIWYMNNYPTHYLLLMGSEGPQPVDWDRLLKRMDIAEVRTDLSEIALANPFRFLSTLLMDDAAVRDYVKGAAINSDEWPLVEFRAPRSTDRFSGARNLEDLLAAVEGEPPIPLLATRYGKAQRQTVLSNLAPYRRAARLLNRGHVSYQNESRDFQGAISYYRRARAANPRDPHIAALIRATEVTRDRILAAYEKAAEAEPHSAGVLQNLGLMLLAANEPARAAEAFRRLVELHPTLADAHLNLARATRLAADLTTARMAIEDAASLAPGRADIFFEQGLIEEAAGQEEAALGAYRRSSSLDPTLAEAHFNAGNVLVSLGRLEEALAAYETGLEHAPAAEHARINLAQILLLLGRPDDATEVLGQVAAQAGPASARAKELLAEIYAH